MLSEKQAGDVARAAGEIQELADALVDKLAPLFDRTSSTGWAHGRVRDTVLGAILDVVKCRVESVVWGLLEPDDAEDVGLEEARDVLATLDADD